LTVNPNGDQTVGLWKAALWPASCSEAWTSAIEDAAPSETSDDGDEPS
jgi:hypothetical protein